MKRNGFLLEDGLLALMTLLVAASLLLSAASALRSMKEVPVETAIDTQWFHSD